MEAEVRIEPSSSSSSAALAAPVANWGSLPSKAVGSVAIILACNSALFWCAASKHFHDGQPRLRALVVDSEECVSHSRYFHSKYLPVDELCIFAVPRRDLSAHNFVDSISERHSAEIMHLFLCSFLTCTGAIPDAQFPGYGARLVRLKALWILQPPRGWSELVQGCTYDLRDCVVQLVRSAAGTLDDLAIIAQVGLFFCDVEELLSAVGGRLQRLSLDLTPWHGQPGIPANEEDVLRSIVDRHCTHLVEPAKVQQWRDRGPLLPVLAQLGGVAVTDAERERRDRESAPASRRQRRRLR